MFMDDHQSSLLVDAGAQIISINIPVFQKTICFQPQKQGFHRRHIVKKIINHVLQLDDFFTNNLRLFRIIKNSSRLVKCK